jgi:threonine aldolase
VGALCGEAVVFPRGNAPKNFFSIIKRHGALLAKGRLVGVQFDALFSDNLYFDISAHAIRMAMKLKQLFADRGYPFFLDSPTNQQFVVIPNGKVRELEQQVEFTHWGATDSHHTVCRFVTSWSTTDADIQQLAKILGT